LPKEKFVKNSSETSKNLRIIRCQCGVEILVLPDLKAMNHAIEVHVAEHREKEKTRQKKDEAASCVRQVLIEQLFEKASEGKNGFSSKKS